MNKKVEVIVQNKFVEVLIDKESEMLILPITVVRAINAGVYPS